LPSFINIYFTLCAKKIQQVKSGCKCITKFVLNKKNKDIFRHFIYILTTNYVMLLKINLKDLK